MSVFPSLSLYCTLYQPSVALPNTVIVSFVYNTPTSLDLVLADSLINTAWTATPVAGYLTSGVVGVSVVDFTVTYWAAI